MSARQDFVIEKGSKFYKEINLTDGDDVPLTLVGKTITCIIKESTATATVLHTLTEANGGIEVLDDALGKVALFISSADTGAVEADFAVYYVMKRDTDYPLLDTERTLEGRITYTKGVNIV